jgi:hypothetical protein
MLWALDKVNSNIDTERQALVMATTAIQGASVLLTDQRSQAAFAALQAYLAVPPQAKLDDLKRVYLSPAVAAAESLGSSATISPPSRAAWAVVAALESAVNADLEAGDRAASLAAEAGNWDNVNNHVNWQAWRTARDAQATGIRGLINLQQQPIIALITALKVRYKNPPPWSRNTVDPRSGQYGPGIGTPTPGSNWSGSQSKGWQAFGTDDPAPVSRTAWVSDTSGNLLATGTYIAPTGSYNWGYKFTGLTAGQTVNVNVQWTFSNSPTITENTSCTVTVGN